MESRAGGFGFFAFDIDTKASRENSKNSAPRPGELLAQTTREQSTSKGPHGKGFLSDCARVQFVSIYLLHFVMKHPLVRVPRLDSIIQKKALKWKVSSLNVDSIIDKPALVV